MAKTPEDRVSVVLLSDTHGHLDEGILRHVRACDEVWHAGDVGSVDVLDQLASLAKLRAVFGNIDGADVRQCAPEYARFAVGGLEVWMTHIGGRPPSYAKGIHAELKRERPALFVCGHSHILLVQRVASWGGLHLNPGAVGIAGFHQKRTLLKFDLAHGHLTNLRVVEWPRRRSNT